MIRLTVRCGCSKILAVHNIERPLDHLSDRNEIEASGMCEDCENHGGAYDSSKHWKEIVPEPITVKEVEKLAPKQEQRRKKK